MGDIADLLMPKLGLTMTEGTVARWLVAPGQHFGAGDVVVVIETDKIANEIEAPAAGEITTLLSSEGDVMPVGAPIAQWRLESGQSKPRAASTEASRPEVSAPSVAVTRHAGQHAHARGAGERIVATPYARRLAREAGVDLARVAGSGPHGRIKADDVLRAKASPPPSTQIAPLAVATERGPTTISAPTSFSFVCANVDVAALRVLDVRLAGTRERKFERLAYIALACTRVLGGDGDNTIRLRFEGNGDVRGIEGTGRDTLSVIAARIAEAAPVDGAHEADVAIFVIEGRARLFVPASSAGSRMTLGVGGVRAGSRNGAADEMTLALTYDSSTLDHASAGRFLDRIAALLEEPLHLLTA